MSASRFHEPRLSWTSSDVNARRTVYVAVDGRVSVTELLAYLEQNAPGVPLDEVRLNWATVTWTRPATEGEHAERVERLARSEARREQWERETLARLRVKYTSDDAP